MEGRLKAPQPETQPATSDVRPPHEIARLGLGSQSQLTEAQH